MESVIDQTLEDSEIAAAAQNHEASKAEGGEAELTARFQYACALIRSKHIQDINHGVSVLEGLYYNGNKSARRDYLFLIAMAQTRLKKYSLALDCVEYFLKFEPENRQAKQLRSHIKDKLTKDGIVGMALTGGAALVLGGLIGLGMSLTRK